MNMNMKLDSTTVALIIGAVIVAIGAYWFFFTGNGNQTPLTTSTVGNEAQSRFQSLVGELQPITFNTAIFSNPSFTALVDLGTPINPEPTGRSDPFGTIPGVKGQ